MLKIRREKRKWLGRYILITKKIDFGINMFFMERSKMNVVFLFEHIANSKSRQVKLIFISLDFDLLGWSYAFFGVSNEFFFWGFRMFSGTIYVCVKNYGHSVIERKTKARGHQFQAHTHLVFFLGLDASSLFLDISLFFLFTFRFLTKNYF